MRAREQLRRTGSALIFVIAGLAIPGSAAMAAGAHSISVSATILSKNNCSFTVAGPSALAFGSIDPSTTSPVTASVSMTFRCTGSNPVATYFVSSDDGLYETGAGAPRMRHATNTSQYLPYTLNLPQSASVPRNVVQTLTITGTVTVAAFQNALAGAYADTVVMTMAP